MVSPDFMPYNRLVAFFSSIMHVRTIYLSKPASKWNPRSYRVQPVTTDQSLEDGDEIHLGDGNSFQVITFLHFFPFFHIETSGTCFLWPLLPGSPPAGTFHGKHWPPKPPRWDPRVGRHPLPNRFGADRLVSGELGPPHVPQRGENPGTLPGLGAAGTQCRDYLRGEHQISLRKASRDGIQDETEASAQDALEAEGEDNPWGEPPSQTAARIYKSHDATLIHQNKYAYQKY